MTLKGISLLKSFEGFRNFPYLDQAGVATIGYGSTFYLDGTKVKMTDAPITQRQATDLLEAVVAKFERDVRSYVKVKLEDHQWDALISFAYNVGSGAFKSSTLLKVINKNPNDFAEIERQFGRWIKAGGKDNKGLKKRRNQEYYYYKNNII